MTIDETVGRFARHRLIPGWNQAILARAVVVVIGIGALGTECARLLAQAGVGTLVLCDPDVVSESNLSRGALFAAADVGRPKAQAAADSLAALAPGTRCEPRIAQLASGVGLAELRDAGLVIGALDSVSARIQLAGRCNLVGAGLLDAGTHPWGGEVRYYPAGGDCFGCALPADQRSARDDPWSCGAGVPAAEAGASAPVSALVASWLAVTALRVLLGLAVPSGTVRLDPVTGWARPVALPRDPDCPLHEAVTEVRRTDLTVDSAVGELLALLAPDETALAWAPIAGGDPSARVDPADFSDRLADAAPAGRLGSIGIAPRELIPVVRGGPPVAVRYLELAATPNGAGR